MSVSNVSKNNDCLNQNQISPSFQSAEQAFIKLTHSPIQETTPPMESFVFEVFDEVESISKETELLPNLSFDYLDSLMEEISPQNRYAVLSEAVWIPNLQQAGPNTPTLLEHLREKRKKLKPSPFRSSQQLGLPLEFSSKKEMAIWKKAILIGLFALPFLARFPGPRLAPVAAPKTCPVRMHHPFREGSYNPFLREALPPTSQGMCLVDQGVSIPRELVSLPKEGIPNPLALTISPSPKELSVAIRQPIKADQTPRCLPEEKPLFLADGECGGQGMCFEDNGVSPIEETASLPLSPFSNELTVFPKIKLPQSSTLDSLCPVQETNVSQPLPESSFGWTLFGSLVLGAIGSIIAFKKYITAKSQHPLPSPSVEDPIGQNTPSSASSSSEIGVTEPQQGQASATSQELSNLADSMSAEESLPSSSPISANLEPLSEEVNRRLSGETHLMRLVNTAQQLIRTPISIEGVQQMNALVSQYRETLELMEPDPSKYTQHQRQGLQLISGYAAFGNMDTDRTVYDRNKQIERLAAGSIMFALLEQPRILLRTPDLSQDSLPIEGNKPKNSLSTETSLTETSPSNSELTDVEQALTLRNEPALAPVVQQPLSKSLAIPGRNRRQMSWTRQAEPILARAQNFIQTLVTEGTVRVRNDLYRKYQETFKEAIQRAPREYGKIHRRAFEFFSRFASFGNKKLELKLDRENPVSALVVLEPPKTTFENPPFLSDTTSQSMGTEAPLANRPDGAGQAVQYFEQMIDRMAKEPITEKRVNQLRALLGRIERSTSSFNLGETVTAGRDKLLAKIEGLITVGENHLSKGSRLGRPTANLMALAEGVSRVITPPFNKSEFLKVSLGLLRESLSK